MFSVSLNLDQGLFQRGLISSCLCICTVVIWFVFIVLLLPFCSVTFSLFIVFILLLFSSFTTPRFCWQTGEGAGPAGRTEGQASTAQPSCYGSRWPGRVLDLEPRQLGSVGGLTFKVSSPWFWPLPLRKPVSPGDLPEVCSAKPQPQKRRKWGVSRELSAEAGSLKGGGVVEYREQKEQTRFVSTARTL